MKTVFEIGSIEESAGANKLLLQIGSDHCTYAWLNEEKKKISRLVYKQYDPLQHDVAALLNNIEGSPSSVVVASAFPQALLVPHKFFRHDQNYLDAVYGLQAQKHLHDQVHEWQVVTVYSVDQHLYETLSDKYSNIQFVHSYTTAIKAQYGISAPHILLNITGEYFSVLVKKNNQLQLAQTYSYKTPLDVVYYLLKICYEYGLQQTEVQLVVSGLLEKKSALYKELRNYFLHMDFAPAPQIKLPHGDYPHHYFTSLYNLSACAL